MTMKLWIGTCAVTAAALGLQIGVGAQGKSTVDGVYGEAQAKRGAALYKEHCAACHGDDLAGNDVMPGLAGETFVTTWQGRTLDELFTKISMTMPALDPGSLKPDQVADVIAHMLSTSKYPAGKTDLAVTLEALAGIKIDAPKR